VKFEPIICDVVRAIRAGLNLDDAVAVEALGREIERHLTPRINPDRRYRLKELEQFGYKKGRFYKANKHLIKKDGRSSYVLGRDLLALNDTAPTVVARPVPEQRSQARPRGRPRKIRLQQETSGEGAEAPSV
jgi:hypothetical protein